MPAISFDADTRTWLLSTPNTSYALRLVGTDVLRHLHWGAQLTSEQAASLTDVPPFKVRGFENVTEGTEELAIDGGVLANPWVMVDAGEGGAEHGEVWGTALAWSGTWRITVQRTSAGVCSVTTGFGHDNITWQLAAGESITTPVSSGLYAADGFGGA